MSITTATLPQLTAEKNGELTMENTLSIAAQIQGTFPQLVLEEGTGSVTEKTIHTLLKKGIAKSDCGRYMFIKEEHNQCTMYKNFVEGQFMHLIENPKFLNPELIYTVIATYNENGSSLYRLEAIDSKGEFRHASSLIMEMEKTVKQHIAMIEKTTFEGCFKRNSLTYSYIHEEKMNEQEANKLVGDLLDTGCVKIKNNNFIRFDRIDFNELLSIIEDNYGVSYQGKNIRVPESFGDGVFAYERAISSTGATFEHNFYYKNDKGFYVKAGLFTIKMKIEENIIEEDEIMTSELITEKFNSIF